MHKSWGSSDRMARRRQRDILSDVMLSARECETWLTLEELAKLTHYPPASISAQLRHLRKPEYGGFMLDKRPRSIGKGLRGEDFGVVWEYRLRRRIRRIRIGKRREYAPLQEGRKASEVAEEAMSVKPELGPCR